MGSMKPGRPAVKLPQVVASVRDHMPASAKEVAYHVGISIDSAHVTLLKLVRAGILTRTGNRWRYRYSIADGRSASNGNGFGSLDVHQ